MILFFFKDDMMILNFFMTDPRFSTWREAANLKQLIFRTIFTSHTKGNEGVPHCKPMACVPTRQNQEMHPAIPKKLLFFP